MVDNDNYKEHEMHFDYDPQCSECFKEKSKILGAMKENKEIRDIDWALMEEKSQHPDNNYW